jgi:hypothetical protein
MVTWNKVAQPFIISLLRKHTYHCWESATSGKAGGLKEVEPLKAVDVVNRSM